MKNIKRGKPLKPVSLFSKEAFIKDINDIDNLVCLCPNHHKELDIKLKKQLDKSKLMIIL